jgi:FAD/FMN-containing dehydrogenase
LPEIKKFFKGELDTTEATLKFYSHDTSLFEIKPQLVVFPKDKEDVEALVKFVADNKEKYPHLSITGRSGGTDMGGGAINDSIIIDFSKHMNEIGVVHENGTDVEPGCFYRDFEKRTLRKHLYMPSYPASRGICALGGMVNNNSGGEKSLTYGKTINYVKEMRVVLRDGKEYEFKANK